ncbi:MAG: sigma-70 family RNA polymerase sigma factor [Planctomycetota bacterium]|nr:MAG: sigma-70 family RNA polymerase sigma factor [Planctomycetota bacterium]
MKTQQPRGCVFLNHHKNHAPRGVLLESIRPVNALMPITLPDFIGGPLLYALLSIFGQISEYVPGNRTWWALNELSHSHTHLSLLDRMGDSRYRADAWSVFIDRYTELFYLWFKHWGVDPHAMEDVLQESMVRILGNIDSFHHNRHGSFRAWLKTVGCT